MVVAVGTLSGGAITSHTVNWLTPFKERMTIISGERACLSPTLLLLHLTHFQNGTIPTTWDQAAVFRGVSEGDMTRFALARKEPLLAEHEAFRDSISRGQARRHCYSRRGHAGRRDR